MTGEQLELAVDNTPNCLWCDRRSTHECDAPLGRSGERPGDFKMYSCDAPMCVHHARRVGHLHVRFSGRRDGKRGAFDTIDHCPYHARPMIPPQIPHNMTQLQAEQLRAEIRRHVLIDREFGIKEYEHGTGEKEET